MPGQLQGRGAVKELRAMENYIKQKVVTSNACFCSATMFSSKIITKIIENHDYGTKSFLSKESDTLRSYRVYISPAM